MAVVCTIVGTAGGNRADRLWATSRPRAIIGLAASGAERAEWRRVENAG